MHCGVSAMSSSRGGEVDNRGCVGQGRSRGTGVLPDARGSDAAAVGLEPGRRGLPPTPTLDWTSIGLPTGLVGLGLSASIVQGRDGGFTVEGGSEETAQETARGCVHLGLCAFGSDHAARAHRGRSASPWALGLGRWTPWALGLGRWTPGRWVVGVGPWVSGRWVPWSGGGGPWALGRGRWVVGVGCPTDSRRRPGPARSPRGEAAGLPRQSRGRLAVAKQFSTLQCSRARRKILGVGSFGGPLGVGWRWVYCGTNAEPAVETWAAAATRYHVLEVLS